MEQAFLVVEEIKEAKDVSLQKTLVSRAVMLLSSLPDLESLMPDPSENSGDASNPPSLLPSARSVSLSSNPSSPLASVPDRYIGFFVLLQLLKLE